jgi:hypothetical protein
MDIKSPYEGTAFEVTFPETQFCVVKMAKRKRVAGFLECKRAYKEPREMREAAKKHEKRRKADGLGEKRLIKKYLWADKVICKPRPDTYIGYECELYNKGKNIAERDWEKENKLYDYDKNVSYAMDFDFPNAVSLQTKREKTPRGDWRYLGNYIEIKFDGQQRCKFELHPLKRVKGRLSCD